MLLSIGTNEALERKFFASEKERSRACANKGLRKN